MKNLPLAKKIIIKRITHSFNKFRKNKFNYADNILINKLSPYNIDITKNSKNLCINFISEKEFFYIENIPLNEEILNSFSKYEKYLLPLVIRNFDLLKGYNKNNFVIYKISQVEYEEYDNLNEFVRDQKLFKVCNTNIKKAYINGFYVDQNTEIVIIDKESDSLNSETNLKVYDK